MPLIKLRLAPTEGMLRTFGIALAVAIVGAGGQAFGWRNGTAFPLVGASACLSLLLALAAPRALRPAWIILSIATFPLGFVLSHVFVAVFYFALLTPVGLLLRATGRKRIALRRAPEAPTYWVKRRDARDTKSYFRQY
jgi:hypothetical protein